MTVTTSPKPPPNAPTTSASGPSSQSWLGGKGYKGKDFKGKGYKGKDFKEKDPEGDSNGKDAKWGIRRKRFQRR